MVVSEERVLVISLTDCSLRRVFYYFSLVSKSRRHFFAMINMMAKANIAHSMLHVTHFDKQTRLPC